MTIRKNTIVYFKRERERDSFMHFYFKHW